MLSKKQISLKAWTKQKWQTKSGKKSSKTGERYLPEKAIKALAVGFSQWLWSQRRAAGFL